MSHAYTPTLAMVGGDSDGRIDKDSVATVYVYILIFHFLPMGLNKIVSESCPVICYCCFSATVTLYSNSLISVWYRMCLRPFITLVTYTAIYSIHRYTKIKNLYCIVYTQKHIKIPQIPFTLYMLPRNAAKRCCQNIFCSDCLTLAYLCCSLPHSYIHTHESISHFEKFYAIILLHTKFRFVTTIVKI